MKIVSINNNQIRVIFAYLVRITSVILLLHYLIIGSYSAIIIQLVGWGLIEHALYDWNPTVTKGEIIHKRKKTYYRDTEDKLWTFEKENYLRFYRFYLKMGRTSTEAINQVIVDLIKLQSESELSDKYY